jgi:hypothetical protein
MRRIELCGVLVRCCNQQDEGKDLYILAAKIDYHYHKLEDIDAHFHSEQL